MTQSDVFHLGLTKADLQGATLAIVPGDPERVKKIAGLMEDAQHLASHREFTTWLAKLDGKPVVVCSTGIGGPSTSIAVEELAQLGVRTFLRVGTTGAIQPWGDSAPYQRRRCFGHHSISAPGRCQPAFRSHGVSGSGGLYLYDGISRGGGSLWC